MGLFDRWTKKEAPAAPKQGGFTPIFSPEQMAHYGRMLEQASAQPPPAPSQFAPLLPNLAQVDYSAGNAQVKGWFDESQAFKERLGSGEPAAPLAGSQFAPPAAGWLDRADFSGANAQLRQELAECKAFEARLRGEQPQQPQQPQQTQQSQRYSGGTMMMPAVAEPPKAAEPRTPKGTVIMQATPPPSKPRGMGR